MNHPLSVKRFRGCFYGRRALKVFKNFTITEWVIWIFSITAVVVAGFAVGEGDFLAIISSAVGAASLVFIAKGDIFGQFLVIAGAILYAAVSYKLAYYGEMIISAVMVLPISVMSVITWARHRYKEEVREIEIGYIKKTELLFILVGAAAVTFMFYFILEYFNTSRLIISTVSVATSFSAACLLVKRSPYYAFAYILNDVVLIIMWSLAAADDIAYLSMAVCFGVYLVNDLYGLINWRRIRTRQRIEKEREYSSKMVN